MNSFINIITIFIISVLGFSCSSKDKMSPNFLRLDKLTTVYFISSNIYELREIVIMENYPENVNLMDSLFDDYIKNKSLLSLFDSIYFQTNNIMRFHISFYKQTKCVEYYINNKESKNHEISGDGTGRNGDCSSDCLGFYFYYRSKEDLSMWYCHYPDEKKDTIWTSRK